MAARQVWLFLTDADVAALLAELERRDPGHVVSWGRYLRGDEKLLLTDPAALERREALPKERKLYLFHRKHSSDLVVHEQPQGPFAGWKQIDEERSDCLVLRLRDGAPGELQPAALYGYVTYWRAADKVKKRAVYAIWANQTLRHVLSKLPPTSVKFMRIGADALAQTKQGTRLTYLYRPIAPEPVPGAPEQPPPDGVLSE